MYNVMFDSYLFPFVMYGVHVIFMLVVFIYIYWCPTRYPYDVHVV